MENYSDSMDSLHSIVEDYFPPSTPSSHTSDQPLILQEVEEDEAEDVPLKVKD